MIKKIILREDQLEDLISGLPDFENEGGMTHQKLLQPTLVLHSDILHYKKDRIEETLTDTLMNKIVVQLSIVQVLVQNIVMNYLYHNHGMIW